MTAFHKPQRVLRRAVPVLAGFIAVVVVTTVTDVVLHALGVFPAWGQPMADHLFLLALGYRTAYAVLGGYIAARLAADRPMFHAVLLGTLGLVLGAAGAVATVGRGPEFGPVWYSLLVSATALPCSWAGGRLYASAPRRT